MGYFWQLYQYYLLVKFKKTAFAAEPTDSSYFTFDESTGAITDYSLDGPKDVVIPEEINGVQVTSIAQSGQTYSSFQGKNLTSVVFPQTIKSIGSGAFANNNLTELTLPDSLEELGMYAFSQNDNLRELTVSSQDYQGTPKLTVYDNFFNLPNLKILNVGNNVSNITNGSFSNLLALETLNLGNSVSVITNGSFCFMNIDVLNIPDSVEMIGGGTFSRGFIKSINIGTSNYQGGPKLTIQSGSFLDTNHIQSITFGNSIKEIGDGAFYDLTSLIYLDLGNSVQSIGKSFTNTKIQQLVIPASVNHITPDTFSGSNRLKYLSIGEGGSAESANLEVVSLFNGANYSSLEAIVLGHSVVSAEASFASLPALKNLIISDSITSIKSSFSGTQLEALFIPNSVTSITSSFNDNPALKMVRIGTKGYQGEPVLALVVGSFSGTTQSAVEQIIFGNNVKSIASGVFYSTPNLAQLDLGESIQSIGASFYYNKLQELVIPDSVSSITDGGFYSSSELKTLVVGTRNFNGEPTINFNSGQFSGLNKLESITLGNTVKSIKGGTFENLPSLRMLDLGESVQTISQSAFSNNNLETITIPSSVTSITSYAFRSNSIKVVLLQGPTTLDDTAFIYRSTIDDPHYVRFFTDYPELYTDKVFRNTSTGVVTGARLFNAVSASIKYVDSHGNDLAGSQIVISKDGSINDYLVASNPYEDYTLYYKIGDVIQITPLAISGYIIPDSISLALSLDSSDNSPLVEFIYYTPQEEAADQNGMQAPNTGGHYDVVINNFYGSNNLFLFDLLYI